jgi:hypothetical protein
LTYLLGFLIAAAVGTALVCAVAIKAAVTPVYMKRRQVNLCALAGVPLRAALSVALFGLGLELC